MKNQIKDLTIKINDLIEILKNLKTRSVDLNLKTSTETIEEFCVRIEKEKLGVEIPLKSTELENTLNHLILANYWLNEQCNLYK
jgi:hypothetical protein